MKRLIVALIAGTFALTSTYGLAAEPMDTPQGQTRTENAKDYVKDKTRKAKNKTKRAAKKARAKTRAAIDNRTTTDPASPSESRPADAPRK